MSKALLEESKPSTDGGGEHVASRPDRRAVLRVGIVATALSFAAMAMWSLAMPLLSGPDEPVHVMKAAAVVRGQILGDLTYRQSWTSSSPFAEVNLPPFYAVVRKVPTCYHTLPTMAANCAPALPQSTSAASKDFQVFCPTPTSCAVFIYNARYPPLYYAIVGLPSLLGSANWVLYCMRFVSALLSSLAIGAAVACIVSYSRRRLILVGMLVAMTPMLFYLGGIVNPVGFEASVGVLVFSSGVVLFLERIDHPPTGLIAVFAGSCCVFELIRGLSPLWLALGALASLFLAKRRSLAQLLRLRSAQVGLAAIGVFGVLAVVWIIKEHADNIFAQGYQLVPKSVPLVNILEHAFARTNGYVPDMIGIFGSYDTWAPLFTYDGWYVLIGFFALWALIVGTRIERLVVLAYATAIVLVPVAISTSQVHRYGYIWAGKDTLGLAVGFPICCAAIIARSPRELPGLGVAQMQRAICTVIGAIVVIAQFGAFFAALRRYAVGTNGPDFGFIGHAKWHPPLGVAVLLVAEAAVLLIGVWSVRHVLDTAEVSEGGPGDLVAGDVGLDESASSAPAGDGQVVVSHDGRTAPG